MKLRIKILFFIVLLLSCCSTFYTDKFDRDVWLSNNNVSDTRNPRSKMTKDLLENYLKPGMTRDSILTMLGEPYFDGIENRLPKGLVIPDSLSLGIDSIGLVSLFDSVDLQMKEDSKINAEKELKELNTWYIANSEPDTLMLYPVGWSTIDPNFLAIKFNPDGTAYEFSVEQH